jgi:hypothetical protein
MNERLWIVGVAQVGLTLSALDNPSYQWLRDGVPIDGATGSRYLLTEADRGATITVDQINLSSAVVPT